MGDSIRFRWFFAITAFALMTVGAVWPSVGSGHTPPGCVFTKNTAQPFGSAERAYWVPHGCVWLRIGPRPKRLPIIRVRQHLGSGRVVTRTFVAPATNLDHRQGHHRDVRSGLMGKAHRRLPLRDNHPSADRGPWRTPRLQDRHR